MRFGHRLSDRDISKAFAGPPTRGEGDHRTVGLVRLGLPFGGIPAVDERVDPLFLITLDDLWKVAKHRDIWLAGKPDDRREHDANKNDGNEVCDLRARDEEHDKQHREKQHRHAEVRLLEDDEHRNQRQYKRANQSGKIPVVGPEPQDTSQDQHEREFHQFGRLEADRADVDPRVGALTL